MPEHSVRLSFFIAMCAFAQVAQATTFVVTSNADGGAGSLRQAVLDANAQIVTGVTACAPHRIEFNIPGAGPHTIQPLSALPGVRISITFDGFTQPGAVLNSASQGNNSVLMIELDGSLAGASDGLQFTSTVPGGPPGCSGNLSAVRGIAINRFQGAAIRVESPCLPPVACQVGGIRIQGNFIGTDISGSLARGNGFGAVLSPGIVFGPNSTRNLVGDEVFEDGGLIAPQNRNVIAANALDGIYIGSSPGREVASAHRIRNNTIGLNAAGTAALPNGRHGIFAAVGSDATKVQDNLIAGNAGDGLRILSNTAPANALRNGIGIGENGVAFGNGGDGVYVGGTSVAVSIGGRYGFSPFGASIANNGGSGVYVADTAIVDSGAFIANNGALDFDLAPPDVNANDGLDPDVGPNGLLNFPVITSAELDVSSMIGTVTGTLNATPGVNTTINFYFNDGCHISGHGGAETFLGGGASVNVIPDAQGNASFSRSVSFLPLGKFITAQARRFSTTPNSIEVSELSACRQVVALGSLFADSFE
jgi:hypothetical protein